MKTKSILFAIAIIATVISANAQEAGKFRGGLDFGYTIPKGGGGIMAALEFKYNLKDNMNVGLRFEDAFMAKELGETAAKISGNTAYLGTFDYYLNSGTSNFAPFVGAGAGYYQQANLAVTENQSGVAVDGKFGGLLRTGFEYKRFRLAATYNLVPASKIDGTTLKVANSYFSISAGFYLFGGKWKK
ncbi:MAG: hypothetical protein LBB62_05260 [Proteiniphilum sp.]|jgi:outer membrane protein W|nr:hypothetical protein [Proteiniphilum sp.]